MRIIQGIIQNCILISLAVLTYNVIWARSPKIKVVLSKTLERDGQATILVSMKAGTMDILNELTRKSFSSRTERSQAVYDVLTTRAQNSQSKILNFLSSPSTLKKFKFGNVRSLWITNQIGIQYASEEFI